jgi:hypothetical protein
MQTKTGESAAGRGAGVSERVPALRYAEVAAYEVGRSSPRRDIEVRTVYVPALECFETIVYAPDEVLAALPEGPLQYRTADDARAWHAEWARRADEACEPRSDSAPALTIATEAS